MAFVNRSRDDILALVSSKADKDTMKAIMDSAINAEWNIDVRKWTAWPLTKRKGKNMVIVPLTVKTEKDSIKLIQKNYGSDKSKISGAKGEITFAVNGQQIIKFLGDDKLKYQEGQFARGTSSVNAALRTKLQEKGSAYIFDLAINRNVVFNTWKEIKTKPIGNGRTAYDGLADIWREDANLPGVEDEWILNFYKQHKVLLPKVGNARFHDVNRDGGFMEWITDFVVNEFGHVIGSKKDNWNPADVWLIRDEDKIKAAIKSKTGRFGVKNVAMRDNRSSAEAQLAQLNQIMRSLWKQKYLMGISLKKVEGSAKFEEVNTSQKFLDEVSKISKMGSFQLGKTGKGEPVCNMRTKEGKRRNTVTWDSDDCRVRVLGWGKVYDFQIKRNSTDHDKFDNLKFEATDIAKGSARVGKAATFMVSDLLASQGVSYSNKSIDFPRDLNAFDDSMERDYKQKLRLLQRNGVDIGTSVEQALKNIKLVMHESNYPGAGNSKLMQISWLHKLYSLDQLKRDKIGTDMFFYASKTGKRFGPHGKIY